MRSRIVTLLAFWYTSTFVAVWSETTVTACEQAGGGNGGDFSILKLS